MTFNHQNCPVGRNQQQRQQQRRGVHDCRQGSGAYKLGLVMGQHVEIFTIYRRHRYYRAFSGPTATRGCSCFPNGWEFLVQILHAYYTFRSTISYRLLFNYFQLSRSYAILSATTQFTSKYARNVHHRPKRTNHHDDQSDV